MILSQKSILEGVALKYPRKVALRYPKAPLGYLWSTPKGILRVAEDTPKGRLKVPLK